MRQFTLSFREIPASLWRNRHLVAALTVREVIGRYRGSLMGVAWSLFNPLLMLAIYTFLFSEVFKMRWGANVGGGHADFAIILFVGLIVHGLFAECINRAPVLILSNANYVKKVIFPLEILPWVALGSALFHAMVSVAVLILVMVVSGHGVPPTAVLFPIVLLPLALGTMGVAWFLAALGVYLRDITQVTGAVTLILLFVSPVFFPIDAVPKNWQAMFHLNPLTYIIEASRNSLVFGRPIDFVQWAVSLVLGSLVAWMGFAWFQKSRKGFADVL